MNRKRYIPSVSKSPVDELMPYGRLLLLGLQHVLVMYAGVVTAPLIVGAALGLPAQKITFLISAALFIAGLVTMIQAVGFRGFGIKLPIMMGVSFTGVGPMIAIGTNPELGLLAIYGSMICAGAIGILVSPLIGKLLRFFPPVVMGTEILMVGLSLMGVSANWVAGGIGNPEYGSLKYISIAFMVLVLILLVTKYARGLLANMAVLLGILFGMLLTLGMGMGDYSAVGKAAWFGFEVAVPFKFGIPRFEIWAICAMLIVMMMTFIESTGMFVAVGDMVENPVDRKQMVKGFRADGAGFVLGSIFNMFPQTSFAQNVGLVGITGVRSRWVCAAAALILILLGLFPKMSAVAASVPNFVLGGAGIIMFGMIVASGIRTLGQVDYTENPFNAYVVAVSVAIGMLPIVAEDFFIAFPPQLSPLFNSSILLSAVAAIILNIFFNGTGSVSEFLGTTTTDLEGKPASEVSR